MTKNQKLLLLLVVLLAVFFRFYQITQMPGGLFPDEAANGLDVNLMQAGHLQPFYERGNGREALFFYMLWGSVEIFGKGPWQHHIISASVGVLSVLVCFFVTRKLFSFWVNGSGETSQANPGKATRIALLAAFLMAVSTWHVVLSRTAFRAILIPLFAGLTFYFLLCAYQAKEHKKRLWYAFLTGASFALGFYSYIAFRIMAPALLAVTFWPFLAQMRHRQFWKTFKSYQPQIIIFVLAFIIFFSPLGKYFYQHPGSFLGRAGQVSVFNPDQYLYNGLQLHGKPPLLVVINAVAEVAKTQILGFFTHGDTNWRQNLSGFPFLSPLISPFFGVGLALVTWFSLRYFFAPNKKSSYWKYFMLGVWFWAMFLPVISTAEGIPHGLRGIGAIPPVFIISAWVLYGCWEWVLKLHKRFYEHWKGPDSWQSKTVTAALKILAVCFVVALILQTYFLYFVYAANSAENFYAFRSDLTPVSEYLVDHCKQVLGATGETTRKSTYLILDKFSVQTTDYLTSDPQGQFSHPCNVPYRQVDPENSWQLSNLKPGDEIVFTQSSIFDTKKFKQFHPEAHLRMETRNKFGQAVVAVYSVSN